MNEKGRRMGDGEGENDREKNQKRNNVKRKMRK